jgi:hypothetical protein
MTKSPSRTGRNNREETALLQENSNGIRDAERSN